MSVGSRRSLFLFLLFRESLQRESDALCTGCRFPDMKDTLQYEGKAGAATVEEMTVLCFMTYRLCCVSALLIANQASVWKNAALPLDPPPFMLLCSCFCVNALLNAHLLGWECFGFSCAYWGMIAVFPHPFPLVPCLKYFLANSSMSYWLSCSALSSRPPSAIPSRETL